MAAPDRCPFERLIYRALRHQPEQEMRWTHYALAMLVFNLLGVLAVYAAAAACRLSCRSTRRAGRGVARLVVQHGGQLRHQHQLAGLRRRDTMSYLTQMLGLTVQNFVSAATRHGGAGGADPRASRARTAETIGNFWVDLDARHALHPAAAVARAGARAGVAGRGADVLGLPDRAAGRAGRVRQSQARPAGQPLKDDKGNPVTEKATRTSRRSPSGPAASQIAIKQLGTNGGGFFNVNSAHPFENPTPLSNFLEMLAILLIPAALCYTFGKMVGDTRQGWAILAAMTDRCSCRCWRSACCARAGGQSRPSRSWASTRPPAPTTGRRQHGRQGGPLRHRQLGAVGHGHDGRLQRFGQLDARFVHAAGRPGADVADATGRSDLRRRRLAASTACWCSPSSPCSSPG